MPWLIAYYQPTSLFSLKHGEATSTGGKSLLMPTPFAIRTALLDIAIRLHGAEYARAKAFPAIRAVRLAIRPPKHIAVSNLFVKILKPERDATRDRAMATTISFREYVHWNGRLGLAMGADDAMLLQMIAPWLPHITYLGKRGGFLQLLEPAIVTHDPIDAPPGGFVPLEGPDLTREPQLGPFPLGIIQRLDEWGPEITYDRLDIYQRDTKAKIRPGRDRIKMDIPFPYVLVTAGRGYALYRRNDL